MDPSSDRTPTDPSSLSSPSTEEASAYPDFISSYTQISNVHDTSQHTDVDSSDEFSEIEDSKTKPIGEEASFSQISSQIVEWSKERFQTYDSDDSSSLLKHNTALPNKFSQKRPSDREKFYYIQMGMLENIEKYTVKLSENVSNIMKFICDSSYNMTSISLESIECFESSLYETCESVDNNIKFMYKIIANCEELNKSLGFIETLSSKIHEIRQTLEVFERILEKN